MRITLLRHAQTDYNKKKLIQGSMNISLNEAGILEAKKAFEELKSEEFEVIYSSDLLRAFETANIVKGSRDIELIKDKRIRERYYGSFEGKNVKDYFNDPNFMKIFSHLDYKLENVEILKDVIKRVESFIDEIKKTSYKNILIVSHYGVIRVINHLLSENPLEKLDESNLKNCGTIRFEI